MTRVILHHIPTNTAAVYFSTDSTTQIESLAKGISNISNDFEILITPGIKWVMQLNKLNNEYLSYFDIEELYGKFNISNKTNELIAEECAFNEEYCEYISEIIVSLSNDARAEKRELALKLSNSILGRAIEILEARQKWITDAYERWKINNASVDEPLKSQSMTTSQEQEHQ